MCSQQGLSQEMGSRLSAHVHTSGDEDGHGPELVPEVHLQAQDDVDDGNKQKKVEKGL